MDSIELDVLVEDFVPAGLARIPFDPHSESEFAQRGFFARDVEEMPSYGSLPSSARQRLKR